MTDQPITPAEPPAENALGMAVRADRLLREMAELEEQIRTVAEIAEQRKADIDLWRVQQCSKVECDLSYRKLLLLEIAEHYPYARGRKSVELPSGSLGQRIQPLSVNITDAGKALDFAKGCNLPVLTTVSVTTPEDGLALREIAKERGWLSNLTEEVSKATLHLFASERRAEDPNWHPHALDDGWSLHGGEDRPFVSPRKVEP